MERPSGLAYQPQTSPEVRTCSYSRILINQFSTDGYPASAFYKKVFNIPFKDPHSESTECRLFDFTKNGVSITGGILKAPDSTGAFTAGKGGIALSWFVEDLDASGNVIEDAGGKLLTGEEKEGDSGLLRYFADTEGNVGSIYMMVK